MKVLYVFVFIVEFLLFNPCKVLRCALISQLGKSVNCAPCPNFVIDITDSSFLYSHC